MELIFLVTVASDRVERFFFSVCWPSKIVINTFHCNKLLIQSLFKCHVNKQIYNFLQVTLNLNISTLTT